MQAMLIQLWVRTGFFVTDLALQHLSIEVLPVSQVCSLPPLVSLTLLAADQLACHLANCGLVLLMSLPVAVILIEL